MYEHQHGALFVLALAKGATACRLFDSAPNRSPRHAETRPPPWRLEGLGFAPFNREAWAIESLCTFVARIERRRAA
jgi:hypothetical protein